MFTMVAVMVLCASGLMAIALDSDVSDAATISDKTGSGSDADPYTIYAYEGDNLDVYVGKDVKLASGELPGKVVAKGDKISGSLSGSARAGPYTSTVSVGSDVKHVQIYVLKPIIESISGNTLRGFGTAADPWQMSVAEGKQISFDFKFYGQSMNVSGDLPDGLSHEGSKITGTLTDKSDGSYSIALTIDGREYHLDLTVSDLFPATVSYVALVLVLIVFVVLAIVWSGRFSRSKKNE